MSWDSVNEAYANESDPAPLSHFRMELLAALEKRSDAQRTALLLVKVDGFTHAEAAGMLGIPVSTVKYQVHEALQNLRARMDAVPTPAIVPSTPSPELPRQIQ